jgi:hypothetical protein
LQAEVVQLPAGLIAQLRFTMQARCDQPHLSRQ